MTIRSLHLARDLTLPLDAVTLRRRLRMPAVVAAAAAVVGLLLRGRPAAVVRRVRAVVVWVAVDRMQLGWTRAHISEKISERTPARANANATPTVLGVVRVSWILAALSHPEPRIVLGRVAAAVRPRSFGGSFALKAAARNDFSAKVVLPDARCLSAIASALPGAMSRADSIDLIEHDKPSESLAGQVLHYSHFLILLNNLQLVGT